ncbi:hydrolase, TatD family [Capnocytophaga sp. oral taxon 332 str. F0381]|jgi:tatD family protein|nr:MULTISPECIES: TatD family hydrolase [Capnocytophaga]EKY07713.1 hydrolase, TatD family [Capnocytophaga sp. oral taxon 332 str. F0381]
MIYLDVHSHKLHSTADTLVIRHQYPLEALTDEPFSVGVHPWYLEDFDKQWEALLHLANHFNCWAIGECGLDKNITTTLPHQQEIFLKHITLAETLGKPLIIHCVKAYAEVVALRKKSKAKGLWVMHGFRKNAQVAKELIANGIALSLGSYLVYDIKLQEVIKQLPQEYLFYESDDSELSVKDLIKKVYG